MWQVFTTDRDKLTTGNKDNLAPLLDNCCIDCLQVHELLSQAKAVVFRKDENEIVAWFSKFYSELWIDVRGFKHKTDAGSLNYLVWDDTSEGLKCLVAMLGIPREAWNCVESCEEESSEAEPGSNERITEDSSEKPKAYLESGA